MAPAVKPAALVAQAAAPVAQFSPDHFSPDRDLSERAVVVAAAERPRVAAAAVAVVAPLHVHLVVAQASPHAQPVVKLVLAVFAAVAFPAFAPLAPRAALHVVKLHCVVSARDLEPAHELQKPLVAPLDPDPVPAPDARP